MLGIVTAMRVSRWIKLEGSTDVLSSARTEKRRRRKFEEFEACRAGNDEGPFWDSSMTQHST